MYCPKCVRENPDDAQFCKFCNYALTKSTVSAEGVTIKTSGMGIASMVLGILSVFSCGITAIPAIILGIISLVQIENSGGRLTGRAFGIVGIAIPVVLCFLILAMSRSKDMSRRMCCEANLRNLAHAWVMYADENNGKLVNGEVDNCNRLIPNPTPPPTDICGEPPWVSDIPLQNGNPTMDKRSQERIIRDGALWEYVKHPKVYRCPAGKANHSVTYQIVDSMNGVPQPGNPMGRGPREVVDKLIVKKRSQIRSPDTRAVFICVGWTAPGSYAVYYDKEKWWNPPPVRHRKGITVSFADAHAEYWKWGSDETIKLGKSAGPTKVRQHIEPKTVEGKADLHKVQKAVWGELGYTPSKND